MSFHVLRQTVLFSTLWQNFVTLCKYQWHLNTCFNVSLQHMMQILTMDLPELYVSQLILDLKQCIVYNIALMWEVEKGIVIKIDWRETLGKKDNWDRAHRLGKMDLLWDNGPLGTDMYEDPHPVKKTQSPKVNFTFLYGHVVSLCSHFTSILVVLHILVVILHLCDCFASIF